MADLIEVASRIMMTADQRLEQTAGNLANMSTAGYRSESLFSEMVSRQTMPAVGQPASSSYNVLKNIHNMGVGGYVSTGNPLDFSISGEGYFRVRMESGDAYTRAGRFMVSPDGRLINDQGYALQDASGGDIILQSPVPEVLADGSVLDGGLPAGRIGVYALGEGFPEALGGGVLFRAADGAAPRLIASGVRQGGYEGSNVSVPAEMIEMMRAVKQAESGARLAQAYDGLLGQAITTFGQRK